MARTFVFLIALGLSQINGLAYQAAANQRLANFDSRTGSLLKTEASSAQQQALVRLRARLPQVRVEFDSLIGSPKSISSGVQFLSGPNGQGQAIPRAKVSQYAADDPHRAVKAFLDEYQQLYGHGSEVFQQARIKRDFVTPHNGLRTVVWEQQVAGIPVFEGVLIAHTSRNGELVNISSQFLPNPQKAASLSGGSPAQILAENGISAKGAVAIAAQNVGESAAAEDISAETTQAPSTVESYRTRRFTASVLKGYATAEPIWLPISRDQLRLCWDVILTSRTRSEMFRLLVDAQTGQVLVRRCLTDYLSDATYRVFTNDSPSPFSPGYSTPISTQPPLVSRSLVTLSALNTNASPSGWIDDGVNETRGNNVDAHTDRTDDDQPDLPRPQGSPFRVFDFPLDLSTQDPTNYSAAAVVQLFYWCNWMHDQLYDLGFTEAAGNFQKNNFGRGGLGNDAVQADAQDGGSLNNANFATPPDGYEGRMQMYIFSYPSPRRDGDLDAEVILHEYTHGLSNRRVGGGVGIGALQTAGMGEGWSDLYAMSFLSQPTDDPDAVYAYGGYASYLLGGSYNQNYYFGIRRYPYCTDQTKNPLTFKDIDKAQASAHDSIPKSTIIGGDANEVHNMGELWCVTLWGVRAGLIAKYGWATGNRLMLLMVTDAMNLSPVNPNFLQERDALLQADQLDNSGADFNEIWTAFAARGMGNSATSPPSTTTDGVVEAFDVPLKVTIPAGATEGDGVLVSAGEVKMLAPQPSDATVALQSSDTSEVTVPASVVIPAGQLSARFDLTIVDDGELDGTQTATITATGPNLEKGSARIDVFDNETAVLQLQLPASVTEGQGTAQGVVGINAVPTEDIEVSLTSSDTSAIQVPSSVTVLAGQTSAAFTMTVIDDHKINGTRNVIVTAHVQNWIDANTNVAVIDNEDLNLRLTLPATVWENEGVITNEAYIGISGALPTNVVVSIGTTPISRLVIPSSVTIPAGYLSNSIILTLQNNGIVDGDETVTISAHTSGFDDGAASLKILDDENPPGPTHPLPVDFAANVSIDTKLAWNNGARTELIQNGDFETGTSTNWRAVPFADWFAINDGTFDPPGPAGISPPYAGKFNLISTPRDSLPELYVYQDISFPPGTSAVTLRWAHRIQNFNSDFDSFQQASVELRDTNNTLLATPFLTVPGDPLLQDWVQNSYDITRFSSQTLRIRFGEIPYWYYLNMSVDNISALVPGYPGIITSDVYFGTNSTLGPGDYLGTTTNWSWTLPKLPRLAPLTTYYWQIIAHVTGLTRPGPVWRFTTAGADHFVWDTIPPLQYTNQPFNVTVTAKDSLNRTVSNFVGTAALSVVGGSAPVTPTTIGPFVDGQWRGAITILQRATSIALRADDGDGHTGFSNPFYVNSSNSPPIIVVQPVSRYVAMGSTVDSLVVADGALPLSYQWRLNGTDIPGATDSVMTLTNFYPNGGYSVKVSVFVTNHLGTALSSNATITFLIPGVVATGPSVNPPIPQSPVAIAGGDTHTMVLSSYGRVSVAGGGGINLTPPANLTGVIGISAGGYHCMALKSDGTVVGWGDNTYGETNVPAGLSNVVAISAGWGNNMVLKNDGTIVAWGYNSAGQTTIPPGLSNVVAISSGFGSFSLALKANGTVVAWGYDGHGQCEVPNDLTNVVAISAGRWHSLALKGDGTLVAWGDNTYHQCDIPQDLGSVIAIAANAAFHNLALKWDGTVVGWGDNSHGQIFAPTLIANTIATGEYHSIAIVSPYASVTKALFRSPHWAANRFTVSVQTRFAHVYGLEYKNAVDGSRWIPVFPLTAGNGSALNLTDASATNSLPRFYRVREW